MAIIRSAHQYSGTTLDGHASAHFGDIYHYHPVPQGRPQSQQHPTLIVPFAKDRDFIDCGILDDVIQRSFRPAARVGLVGLGGVGKTQIAIEYAYRRRAVQTDTWVFWVHASSAARFEESYRQIAQQMQINGWADLNTEILSVVHNWLLDERNGRWVMVVDNADSSEVMFGPYRGEGGSSDTFSTSILTPSKGRSLSDFLPSSAHGSILITSRSREVLHGMIEYADDILDVGPFEQDDAIALLTKKLRVQSLDTDRTGMIRLVQELDYMPLAITQAAGFINQLGTRSTVSEYLDRLTKSDLERDRLLEKDIRDLRRDKEASNSIVNTWHTSFEHMREFRASAARLLALMSLFDRNGIPENLLKGNYLSIPPDRSEDDQSAEQVHDSDTFDADVRVLINYSLISIDPKANLFGMHRLVQISTKKWLDQHSELAYWQARYTRILDGAFPSAEHTNWPTCRDLFPHVEAMLSYEVTTDIGNEKRAAVMYRAAWYADESGQYGTGFQMARVSATIRERLLGRSAADTLKSRHMMAGLIMKLGRSEESEAECWKILEEREEHLGKHHIDTFSSLNDLTVTLRIRGKFEDAEKMGRRALEASREAFGTNDYTTFRSMDHLASVLRNLGKYDEAESLVRPVLEKREKYLGADHPDTLNVMNNLMVILWAKGQYREAKDLARRTLESKERVLGKTHYGTIITRNNLGWILRAQGRFEAAEKIFRQTLAERQQKLGDDHPETLASMHCLASILYDRKRYDESLYLFDKAIAGYKKGVGPPHHLLEHGEKQRHALVREMNSLVETKEEVQYKPRPTNQKSKSHNWRNWFSRRHR